MLVTQNFMRSPTTRGCSDEEERETEEVRENDELDWPVLEVSEDGGMTYLSISSWKWLA